MYPAWLVDMIDRECAAAHAAMDRKQAEIDKYGYGRPPGYKPGTIVGLCESGLMAKRNRD